MLPHSPKKDYFWQLVFSNNKKNTKHIIKTFFVIIFLFLSHDIGSCVFFDLSNALVTTKKDRNRREKLLVQYYYKRET